MKKGKKKGSKKTGRKKNAPRKYQNCRSCGRRLKRGARHACAAVKKKKAAWAKKVRTMPREALIRYVLRGRYGS